MNDIDPKHLALIGSVTGAMDSGCKYMEETLCLYRLASDVEEGVIVEFGSWKGKSTVALALGSNVGAGVPVYAVDPHEPMEGVDIGNPWTNFGPHDWLDFYESLIRCEVTEIVRPVALTSRAFMRAIRPSNPEERHLRVGLLWIDASHEYEQTYDEVFGMLPHLIDGASIVLDDRKDEGVARVIEEMQAEGWEGELVGVKVIAMRRSR